MNEYHVNLITGDTHITGDLHPVRQLKSQADAFEQKHGVAPLDVNDKLFITGDVSLLFSVKQTQFESQLIGEFNKHFHWTTLFVDGNHENFDRLNKIRRREWCGGEVGVIANKLLHLRRAQVFEIDSKTFFVCGGGNSMDKEYRTPGVSWWPEELLSKAEKDQAYRVLDSASWKVDYVITHVGPRMLIQDTFPDFIENPSHRSRYYDPVELFLDKIYERLEYKHWYCGHYHADKYLDKFTILYDDIVDIDTGEKLFPYIDNKIEDYFLRVCKKKRLL